MVLAPRRVFCPPGHLAQLRIADAARGLPAKPKPHRADTQRGHHRRSTGRSSLGKKGPLRACPRTYLPGKGRAYRNERRGACRGASRDRREGFSLSGPSRVFRARCHAAARLNAQLYRTGLGREKAPYPARCLIVASLVPETSSLVAMEALAAGTPVVAFANGALPEIIDHGKTGLLVSDEDEMAAAIEQVDRLSPHACRAAARDRFDVRHMIDRYFAVYEKIARLHGRRPGEAA